jgi:hypothetical protein
MLSLPRELAVLCQTKLTLVAAEAVGHDPIKATGLVLAHITRICEQTRMDTAQVWRLRTSTRPAEEPWDFLCRVAERRAARAPDLYPSERATEVELGVRRWLELLRLAPPIAIGSPSRSDPASGAPAALVAEASRAEPAGVVVPTPGHVRLPRLRAKLERGRLELTRRLVRVLEPVLHEHDRPPILVSNLRPRGRACMKPS